MPTYVYECHGCNGQGELNCGIEHFDSLPESMPCDCGSSMRRIIAGVGVVIPEFMKAMSDDVGALQARYLKSDKHREMREQTERIQDRNSAFEQEKAKWAKSLPDKVLANA